MDEERLFELLVNTPETERRDLLDQHSAGNPQLRARIEARLAADQATSAIGPADDPSRTEPGTRSYLAPIESPGAVIAGRYKLLQQIGEGGMGTVWMAEQTEPVKRRVAVKLIRTERGMSATILARFEAERQAIALMDHPHIARLLDAGTTHDGAPFFVMELVNGVPLNEYCDQQRLSVSERLTLFTQVCRAIQHAHQKGIIHRDIKPSNILVEHHDGKPVPKVIDFGLAKATTGLKLTENTLFTGFGTVLGTPLYMAPEQAGFNATDVDTRADIYALGVILYEMLTGTTPLTRDTIKQAALDEMLRLIREQEAPTPSSRLSSSEAVPSIAANRQTEPAKLGRFLKGELDWITLKALAKERERRYESASGLAMDIERFLNQEPVSAGPPSARYRFQKFVQRNRGQVLAASVVLAALVLGTIGTSIGYLQAKRAAERERLAKVDAEGQRDEKERQRQRAEDNERLAKTRLIQVQEEQQRTQAEKRVAQAVRDFLQNKLLGQADAMNQANALIGRAPIGTEWDSDPRIRDLLARAADELAPESIEENFPREPLLQAELLETVGKTYVGIGGRNDDQYAQALGLLQRAVALRSEHSGSDHPETLASRISLAQAHLAAGQIDLALPQFEESLALIKAKLGPDHPDTLATMNNLAQGYLVAGQLDRALPLFEEALALLRAKLGPDHPDTLASMNNLAQSYFVAGQLDRALALFEETLALAKVKLGSDHPATLATANNLAQGYFGTGQLDRALPILEENLALLRTKRGPDHPDTTKSMNNLAIVYAAAGQLDRALPLYVETVALLKAKLGPNHPDTLLGINNLAQGYVSAGRLDQALPLFEDAFALQKELLGPDHPDTLTTMGNLADAYRATGKLDRALPMLEETLALTRSKLGPEHFNTFRVMGNLAVGYQDAGQLDKALPLYQETYRLQKDTLGTDHPATLISMGNLAAAYWSLQMLDKSIPLLEESLTLQEKALGRDHPDTLLTLANLGVNYRDAGRLKDAIPLLEEVYRASKSNPAIRWVGTSLLEAYGMTEEAAKATPLAAELLTEARERLPEASPELAGQLAMLGLALIAAKAEADAEPLLRESLAIRDATQPEVWTTFNTMSLLGGALLGQAEAASERGDAESLERAAELYREAEPLLIRGYEGMKARETTIPLRGGIRLLEALDRLIALYTAWNKPDDAKKWQAEKAERLQAGGSSPDEPLDLEKK